MQSVFRAVLACALFVPPAVAGDEEWLSMDSELESMRSFAAQSSGVQLSGWILSSLRHADDIIGGISADGTTTNDVGGFNLDSVRLNVDGAVGEQSYHISFELGEADGVRSPFPVSANRTGQLLDAYIDWRVAENVSLRVGSFRSPFVQSALIQRNLTLFVDRSAIGAIHAPRQAGAQLAGDYGKLRWYVAAQNGLDGIGDELLFTGRVEFDLIGNVASPRDPRGGEETSLTMGLAAMDDGGHVDGFAIAGDAQLRAGPLYLAAEIVDYDGGTAPALGAPDMFGLAWPGVAGVPLIALLDVSDTTPFAVTVAAEFDEDRTEVAVRYEDNDLTNGETADQEAITFGINRHMGRAKLQLTYTLFRTELPGLSDADILALALSLGF